MSVQKNYEKCEQELRNLRFADESAIIEVERILNKYGHISDNDFRNAKIRDKFYSSRKGHGIFGGLDFIIGELAFTHHISPSTVEKIIYTQRWHNDIP